MNEKRPLFRKGDSGPAVAEICDRLVRIGAIEKSSNFIDESDNYEKIKLKQIEVATEWDKIEYTLQDDKFWYFLNNNKDFDYPTRIELVLNLVADIEPSLADDYATFRCFSDKFQESPKNIEQIKENWKKVKQTFQSLEEWFDDRSWSI